VGYSDHTIVVVVSTRTNFEKQVDNLQCEMGLAEINGSLSFLWVTALPFKDLMKASVRGITTGGVPRVLIPPSLADVKGLEDGKPGPLLPFRSGRVHTVYLLYGTSKCSSPVHDKNL
jgi:hypothetical protein